MSARGAALIVSPRGAPSFVSPRRRIDCQPEGRTLVVILRCASSRRISGFTHKDVGAADDPFVLRFSKDELDSQAKILLQKSVISCGKPASIVARQAGAIHSVLFSRESAKNLALQYMRADLAFPNRPSAQDRIGSFSWGSIPFSGGQPEQPPMRDRNHDWASSRVLAD